MINQAVSTNLRKLGTPSLYRKVARLVDEADDIATNHPSLAEAWGRIVDHNVAGTVDRTELLDLGDMLMVLANEPLVATPAIDGAWRELEAEVASHVYEYPTIEFPIFVVDPAQGVFQSANGVQFRMAEMGAGYLSERLPHVKYAVWTALWRASAWQDIVDLLAAHGASLSGRKFIMSLVDGEACAFMTHYQYVGHQSVLDILKAQGLTAHLVRWHVNATEMQVDLKVADLGHNLITVVRVLNGHTGHYALRFTAALLADGYEWEAGGELRTSRRRHMSHVGEIVEELKTAVDQVAGILFDENLRSIGISEALAIIGSTLPRLKVRQEQVLQAAEAAGCKNALEMIGVIAPYGQTAGWGSAVASVLDPLVRRALSMGTGA